MNRIVHLVGVEDPFEVLCETPTTMILINPTARRRQYISDLEDKLAILKRELAAFAREPVTDTGGVPMVDP